MPSNLNSNPIHKIQNSQIYTIIKNLILTLQCSQKIKFQILNRTTLASKIWLFLSFHVFHQIAKGINFQTPMTQNFFNLLLQATNTSLMVLGCTQLNPSMIMTNATKRRTKCCSSRHIEHRLSTLRFLLSGISSIGIFPLVASQAKKHTLGDALDLQIAFA